MCRCRQERNDDIKTLLKVQHCKFKVLHFCFSAPLGSRIFFVWRFCSVILGHAKVVSGIIFATAERCRYTKTLHCLLFIWETVSNVYLYTRHLCVVCVRRTLVCDNNISSLRVLHLYSAV